MVVLSWADWFMLTREKDCQHKYLTFDRQRQFRSTSNANRTFFLRALAVFVTIKTKLKMAKSSPNFSFNAFHAIVIVQKYMGMPKKVYMYQCKAWIMPCSLHFAACVTIGIRSFWKRVPFFFLPKWWSIFFRKKYAGFFFHFAALDVTPLIWIHACSGTWFNLFRLSGISESVLFFDNSFEPIVIIRMSVCNEALFFCKYNQGECIVLKLNHQGCPPPLRFFPEKSHEL